MRGMMPPATPAAGLQWETIGIDGRGGHTSRMQLPAGDLIKVYSVDGHGQTTLVFIPNVFLMAEESK